MKLTRNMLSDAVRTCLALGAVGVLGLTAAPAFAQEESGQTLERIEVTGSRIRAVDVETAQPVFSISRQEIEAQGFASVADILQNISAAGSPPISRAAPLSSGENPGGQYIDLRGIGANRTLVLVNGKRLPLTTSGLQDLSAVPAIMVERIDILKDGASSIYGSDAIAGVVNIITRRNFDGMQVEAYYGQFSEGDGETERFSGVLGTNSDRGYITLGAEYRKENGVWAKDRDFADPRRNPTVVGQWGNFLYNGGYWAPDRGSSAIGLENFHRQTSDDTSVPTDQMHFQSPLEARTLFISAGYDLSSAVHFSADVGYSQRTADSQIAGYPFQSAAFGTPMSAGSYFNPVGQSLTWRRRGWEVPRTTSRELNSWRFAPSLEGTLDFGKRYIDWQVGYTYADNDLTNVQRGDFHLANVAASVGPSFLNDNGIVQCGTPDAPIALSSCTPWNPFAGFGTGAVENSLDDPAVQAFLFPTFQSIGSTSTTTYFANASGNLFTLPAGDLSYAVGYERRKEKGGYSPDALSQSGAASTLAAGATYGEYSLDEFFVELDIPLISEVTGFQELGLSIASRYSDYDSFGDTTNNKVGFRWRPINDLLVRATWAEGFRAPSISQLYGGGSQTFTTGFRDPCDSVYGDARGSARCLQDVPADYRQLRQGFVPTTGPADQTPVPFVSGSNALLQPETAESYTAGIVYSPSFVENLNISLDWWRIEIEDTMVSDHPNNILSDCYISLIESRCAMFSRDPNMHIVNNLTYGQRNAGFTKIEGFDFGVNYRYESENFGAFGVNWNSSYFSDYLTKSTNDPGVIAAPSVGFARNGGIVFRMRSNLGLSWSYGDFGATWGMRYYSNSKELCAVAGRCNSPGYSAPWTQGAIQNYHTNGSTTYNDVQVRWNAPWDATISLGANNVFDKIAPPMYSQPSSNFDYYGGFDIGRFVYMKYQQNF